MKKSSFITSLLFGAIATIACVIAILFMFRISGLDGEGSATATVAGAILYTMIMGAGLITEIVSTAFAALFAGISVSSESSVISRTAKVELCVLATEILLSAIFFFVLL